MQDAPRRSPLGRPHRVRPAWRRVRNGVGSGPSPAGCRAGLRNRLEGIPLVVMEHEERPLIGRQPPEPAFELVPVGKSEHVVGSRRSFDRENPQVRRPPTLARRVVDAFMDDEAMEPRIEPVRIASRASRARRSPARPAGHPRPGRHRGESGGPARTAGRARADQGNERRLVPSLGRLDELTVHVSVPLRVRRGRGSEDNGLSALWNVQSFAAGARCSMSARVLPSPSAKNAIHSSMPVSWTKMRWGSLVSSTPRLPSSA